MRKKGFYKESTYQLILIFISLVFLGMLVGSIFSGMNLQNAICKAVPWLCGERQEIDYELSDQSTQNFVCAIGSAFLQKQWDGGDMVECNWGPATSSKSGVSGAVTGNVPAEMANTGSTGSVNQEKKEKMSLSELRKLEPSVNCNTDENGKYACAVKNFVMPQEIKPAEEWILYWGDPHYLVYWSAFPHEEDTWNFKISWIHHGLIALISMIPPAKVTGLGFKTIFYAIKGPAKKEIAEAAAKMMIEEGSKSVGNSLSRAVAKKLITKEEAEVVGQAIRLTAEKKIITEAEVEATAKILRKGLAKKEIKAIFAEMGGKLTRAGVIKKLYREQLVKTLTARLRSKWGLALIFGTEIVGEAAIAALADSQMNKYDPVGNSVAIKNPGNKTEDIQKFPLPDEMKGKPVLTKWKPVGEEIKHAHFASPCYLEEFYVNYEKNVVCDEYVYDRTTGALTCENAKLGADADIICNVFEPYIDSITSPVKIYDRTKDFLRMEDKSIFGYDEDWNLTKIYIPWVLNEDDDGPKYYLSNIKYSNAISSKTLRAPIQLPNYVTGGPLRSGFRIYTAKIYDTESPTNKAFTLFEDEDKYIMFKGKEYLLHIYHIADDTAGIDWLAKDDVGIDVYDLAACQRIMDITQEPYKIPISCEDARKHAVDAVFQNNVEEKIKNTIEGAKAKSGGKEEFFVKVTPEKDIKPIDIDALGGITGCGSSGDSRNCFRILGNIEVEFLCEPADPSEGQKLTSQYQTAQYGLEFLDEIIYKRGYHPEVCEIDLKNLNLGSESKDLESFRIYRTILLNDTCTNLLTCGDSTVISSIEYESQSYTLPGDIVITFDDGDEENIKSAANPATDWDTISISRDINWFEKNNPFDAFTKGRNSFTIALSAIKDNGDYDHVTMTNCKTEGIIISFKDDNLAKSKLDVEGPNYCMRQVSGLTKVLKTAGDIVSFVGPIVVAIITRGATLPVLLGAVGGGATYFATQVNYEHKETWPSSQGR